MKTNILLPILAIFFLFSCKSSEEKASAQLVQQAGLQFTQDSLPQSEAEWKALLSPEQYRVLRQKGTERAFTGHLLKNKKKGIYTCGGCGLELFHSSTKFESGTGWPSFFDVYKQGHVGLVEDSSHGMLRSEVVCNRCQGHLGHVFEDGPKPTGLRYCINSVSLSFVEED